MCKQIQNCSCFPPIQNDPGGYYVKGDYDISEDEPFEEDYSIDDSALPEDFQEEAP